MKRGVGLVDAGHRAGMLEYSVAGSKHHCNNWRANDLFSGAHWGSRTLCLASLLLCVGPLPSPRCCSCACLPACCLRGVPTQRCNAVPGHACVIASSFFH